jgi:hypothetical protein
MEPDQGKTAPTTPTGWKRNAQGFDEPQNSSPSGKAVLIFFGGLVTLIVGIILLVDFLR